MIIQKMPDRDPKWDELHRKARQIRKVRTNPGSYKPKELDDKPIVGEFTD
jgi:hypothetical protein